jgi:FKBP-type peptidyl-prolyl cis-trans isomerase FklB
LTDNLYLLNAVNFVERAAIFVYLRDFVFESNQIYMNFLKPLAYLTAASLVTFTSFAQTKPKTKPKLTVSVTKVPVKQFNSAIDSVSYAVGVLVAQNFKSQKVTLNPEMVAKGFASVTNGGTLLISEQECQSVMNNFMMKNQQAQAAEQAKQYEPNRIAGEKFLAENKLKDSVITTASGLQFKVIKMGDGPKPTAADKVKTHYHGTLINGEVFDSSVQRGEPVSFPVSGVIPGWVEALQLMPVGSKFKLYIPQELAYGIRGGGQTIKPYSALVFEVELLAIEKE